MQRDPLTVDTGGEPQAPVAWSAVLAGAVASLALSLSLMAIAAGFGLKLRLPWPGMTSDGAAFTPVLGAWMVLIQVVASALGGYLAGRLRTRWMNLHAHEAHFRDTAHGLLVWAAITLAGAVLIAGLLATPSVRPSLGEAQSFLVAQAAADPATLRKAAEREANREAQAAFFMGFGLLLSAFSASVAATIGGLRREQMYDTYWTSPHAIRTPAIET
jgi:hypothetical protein